jgi:exonuclease SbcC
VRFESIKIRNLGPFKDVDLNLSELGGPGALIAITGNNGDGKSTLLELLPAAFYRECRTRGTLVSLATARDAMLEVKAVNGRAYTFRQSTDSVSRKSEALILDEHGQSVLEGSSVRASDAWVAHHLPAPDVLYTSEFLPQQSGGFLDMGESERKSVLLRILQIERYEQLADKARERARRARSALEIAHSRLSEIQKRYPDPDAAAGELAACQIACAVRLAEVAAFDAALHVALEHLELQSRQADLALQRDKLTRRIATTQADAAMLAERISNNRMFLARRDEILAATSTVARVDATLPETRALLDAARAQCKRVADAEQDAKRARKAAQERLTRAQTRIADLTATLSGADPAAAAQKKLPAATKALDVAKRARLAAFDEWQAAQTFVGSASRERIEHLRVGHAAIAGGAPEPRAVATRALAADDKRGDAATTAPKRIEALRLSLVASEAAIDTARATLETIQLAAARMSEMQAAKRQLESAQVDRQTAAAELIALQAPAVDHADAAQREVTVLTVRLQALEAERSAAAALHSYATPLAAAAARIEELLPQHQRLTDQLVADQAELAALPAPQLVTVDVPAARRMLLAAQERERMAHASIVRAQERVKSSVEGGAACARVQTEIAELGVELADWQRLGADLGKDGLQALEIDAAIPLINTLTNDLLHTCHGSRFTVELHTDRLAPDGKRTLEDLEVRVLDTVRGRQGLAETYSGGERVIIGEAVSLALTMVGCLRAGVARPTLVRDESGAALDVDNGRVYIAMLRRAATLVGADKVLFVSQSPELQHLADVCLAVRDGTVAVLPSEDMFS